MYIAIYHRISGLRRQSHLQSIFTSIYGVSLKAETYGSKSTVSPLFAARLGTSPVSLVAYSQVYPSQPRRVKPSRAATWPWVSGHEGRSWLMRTAWPSRGWGGLEPFLWLPPTCLSCWYGKTAATLFLRVGEPPVILHYFRQFYSLPKDPVRVA